MNNVSKVVVGLGVGAIITYFGFFRMGHRDLPAAAKPRRVIVSLSESAVTEMESDWNELPHQIEASREARGWRIKHLMPNSILYHAGFRRGDLITGEFLENLKNGSGVDLAHRVENILNRVSR